MVLEKQVCSLELAKIIKEFGVKQESLFYWQDCGEGTVELQYIRTDTNFGISVQNHYSAFTVAELGEMLPNFKSGKNASWKEENEKWICKKLSLEKLANTEADARAKMLIYLIKEGGI